MNLNGFPWLDVDDHLQFPNPNEIDGDVIATGANLTPGVLLSAYKQGIFPWFGEGEDILWWSLDPRFLLYTKDINISKSMKKLIRKCKWQITIDKDFKRVINNCSTIKRSHEEGTWIVDDMIEAYTLMHKMGWVHSVEVWDDNELIGGLYGISIGRIFCGESMFAKKSNSSKVALIALSLYLNEKGFEIIDCQQPTEHLRSMGAIEVSREDFLNILKDTQKNESVVGSWNEIYKDFPSCKKWDILKE